MTSNPSARDLLKGIRKQSDGRRSRASFVPPKALLGIFTENLITQIICCNSKIREDERHLFMSLILQEALKIFSILLYDHHEDHIQMFLYRRLHDNKLPFSPDDLKFLPEAVSIEFVERQWEYIPVDLKRGDLHRDLRNEEILPFLQDEYFESGAFGEVFKVQVQVGCHHLGNRIEEDHSIKVVRKQLKTFSQTNDETTTLELLRRLRHPNIVELLGSYTHLDTYNMLFPPADMDLRQFFRAKVNIESDILLSEAYGLADGLTQLHSFTLTDGTLKLGLIGYHHDLRPANILVRGDRFLIADFGLSNLKPDDQTSKSRLIGGQDDYLSPETFDETNWTNGIVGRALDIWAFGCILAEFATYIDGQSVEEFRQKREATHRYGNLSVTDNAFHLNGILRPQVDSWLKDIASNSLIKGIPDLVFLIREMLNPVWRKRIDIHTVAKSLAIVSVHSKVVAVKDQFLQQESNIFILLESKRFAAWNQAYCSVERLNGIPNFKKALYTLNELKDCLQTLSNARQDFDGKRGGTQVPESICAILDTLTSDLPLYQQQQMDRFWVQEVTEIDDVNILRQIKEASTPERYRTVGIKAAQKYMSRMISESNRSGGRKMLLDQGVVEFNEESLSSQRVDGIFDDGGVGFPVLVEWTGYDHQWKGEQGGEMQTRMEALAKLLNPVETLRVGILSNRVLDCLGYFHEISNYRFGFIYSMPTSIPELEREYCSLEETIASSSIDQQDKARPALDDIFELAKALVTSLEALHEVSWLHKGMSSGNILVFYPSGESPSQHIASAVIAGFSQSRPELAASTLGRSKDFRLYQNPGYLESGASFRRTYDIFSAGIILLEIGLWDTVSRLHEKGLSPPDDSKYSTGLYTSKDAREAERNRNMLLQKYVPRLVERMGTTYRDAVQFCLEADQRLGFPNDDPAGRRMVQEAFRANVVHPLSKCFV